MLGRSGATLTLLFGVIAACRGQESTPGGENAGADKDIARRTKQVRNGRASTLGELTEEVYGDQGSYRCDTRPPAGLRRTTPRTSGSNRRSLVTTPSLSPRHARNSLFLHHRRHPLLRFPRHIRLTVRKSYGPGSVAS